VTDVPAKNFGGPGRIDMNAAKEAAIRVIQSLPDDCTMEDIHYHLYVREKIRRGQVAADAVEIVSQAEAERLVQEWSKSSGPAPR
jgi:hypothetical protein